MRDGQRETETETNPFDPVLERAIGKMLPDAGSWTPVGGRSFLALGTWGDRDLRVRRWPNGTSQERVRFVNRLHTSFNTAEPLLCARPFTETAISESWLVVDGILVDVQEWLPGKSLVGRATSHADDGHAVHRPVPLTPEQHIPVIQRIAASHQRSALLAADRHAPHAPIPQVMKAIGQAWGAARVSLRPKAPITPPIQRWLKLGEQVLPAAEEAIKGIELTTANTVIAHLDLWPGHLIIDRADEIRLIDYSLAVATTPLLDIAQLVTRFPGWTGENAEQVLGHYADVRSLSPDERRTLPAFAALDLVIEAGRLLRLGYTGALPTSSRGAVAARAGAQDMLNSLEAVLPAVVRGSNPVPFVKRQKLAKIKSAAGTGVINNPNAPKTRKRRPKK